MDDKAFRVIFYAALVSIAVLFLYVLSPFFYPIFWAGVIASIFRPLFNKLNKRKARPNLNSLITLAVVVLILILPLAVTGSLLLKESIQIYNNFARQKAGYQENIQGLIDRIQHNRWIQKLNINERSWADKLSQAAESIVTYILGSLKNWTQNFLVFLIMFVIMLYTLFYFIRDGDKILEVLISSSPLGKDKTRLLLDEFVSTAKATLRGTLILGGVQGLLGGILFWIVGIEAALIWGLIMVVASILPTGSGIVWAPAGILMLLTGHVWEGVTILVVGALVIGIVDNLLRPLVVGKEIGMHPVLIFLSTMGGLVLFGFSGFVIGPVITSMLLALWDIYTDLNGPITP
ncbi:MAG: AI-2E family transporter [Syntrophales bacterium]